MNIIDIIILVIIALSTLAGYKNGFVLTLFNFLKIFLSIIISGMIYPNVIEFLNKNTLIYNNIKNFIYPKIIDIINGQGLLSAESITQMIISFFIFIIIYFIVSLVLSMIIEIVDSFFRLPLLKSINKFTGLLLGFVKGALIIFIIYALLTPVILLNSDSFIAISTRESILGMYFYRPDFFMEYLLFRIFNVSVIF